MGNFLILATLKDFLVFVNYPILETDEFVSTKKKSYASIGRF